MRLAAVRGNLRVWPRKRSLKIVATIFFVVFNPFTEELVMRGILIHQWGLLLIDRSTWAEFVAAAGGRRTGDSALAIEGFEAAAHHRVARTRDQRTLRWVSSGWPRSMARPPATCCAVYVFSLEHQGLTAEIDEFFVSPDLSRAAASVNACCDTAEDMFRSRGCTNVALQIGRDNNDGPGLLPRPWLRRPRWLRTGRQDCREAFTAFKMYDLYIGNKNYSSWSLRPWVLMRELNIPFREVLVPFGGAQNPDAFRAFSPTGKVPCLVDGTTTVWDSLAITEYLAERHAGVWPADADGARLGALRGGRNAFRLPGAAQYLWHELRPPDPPACDRRPRCKRDLQRIEQLWAEGLARFGGPFLTGAQLLRR